MYEFTEDCMIHIEQIDNEHRKLFQMLNEAFTMVQETEDVSAITISLLSNLKNYAMTHFAHEEAYMESIHDPELSLQKTQHAMFTRKVNSFVPDTSSPEAARKSLNDLLTYLVRWLYRHIFMQRYDDWEIPFEFRERSFCLHIQIHDRHYTH